MAEKDMLIRLFEMQDELNRRIGMDAARLTEEEQVAWVLNYARAMSQELAELTDSVPWKWWAKYQNFDRQNARVEVVDMLHFLISLAQVLGLTAPELFELYSRKHRLNHERQDGGYAVKDHADNTRIGG